MPVVVVGQVAESDSRLSAEESCIGMEGSMPPDE